MNRNCQDHGLPVEDCLKCTVQDKRREYYKQRNQLMMENKRLEARIALLEAELLRVRDSLGEDDVDLINELLGIE